MAKKAKKEIKKYPELVAPLIILVFIIICLIVAGCVLKNMKPEKTTYTLYQQICERPDSYFQNQSIDYLGRINKTNVVNLKNNDGSCYNTKSQEIDYEGFEELYENEGCHCAEYNGGRICEGEGYVLSENRLCVNEKLNTFSHALLRCSRYSCEKGKVIELSYS